MTEGQGAPGETDAERAAWLADKIGALGDYAKEAAAMLRRWPAGLATPSGWKLVPVRPIQAMLDAFYDAPINDHGDDSDWAKSYRAMLAAALAHGVVVDRG